MRQFSFELGVGGTILFYLSFLFGTALILFGVVVFTLTKNVIDKTTEVHFLKMGIFMAQFIKKGDAEEIRRTGERFGAIDVIFISEEGVNGISPIKKNVAEKLKSRCAKAKETKVRKQGKFYEVFYVYPKGNRCLLTVFRERGEFPPIFPQLMVITLAFFSVFIPFGYWFIRKTVVLPVKNLYSAVERIAGGEESVRAPVEGPREIKVLAERFNNMVEELISKKEELSKIVAELERVNVNLKKAQQEIIQAEKLAVVGRLASGIAHEIGNPVNVVYMLLELIKDAEGEMKEEYLERIKYEVERIENIAKSLLDLARPIRPEVKEVDINEVVKKAVDVVFIRKIARVNVKTELSSLPAVETDPSMLMQVFVNLLLNARDAVMDKGEGEVVVKTERKREEVIIEVRDTGTGIDENILPNIFEPFFTTKPKEKGTGLGLTISQRIIRELGGRIEVESEKGKGTIFRVILFSRAGQPSSGV